MTKDIFDEKTEALIKEAIDSHQRFESFHKSMYPVYLEYETASKERRRELSKTMRSKDDLYDNYCNKLTELNKRLNSHDYDIALRKINKAIINYADLWTMYYKWKSARSTMVV